MVNVRITNDQSLSLRHNILRLAQALADWIIPPVCLGCATAVGRTGALCGTCWSQVQFVEEPFCPVLGTPLAYNSGLGTMSLQALADPPPFDRARAAVLYDDVARRIIRSFKFGDSPELAPWMAAWMMRVGQEFMQPEAVIVPVPLHRNRLIHRRFNQSAELARNLSRMGTLRYRPEILSRVRSTRQQVGLGAKERARNVQGAFHVPKAHEIEVKGSHIILVDDVYTTGATLRACARALRRKGAAKIDCLTFARVANGVANAEP